MKVHVYLPRLPGPGFFSNAANTIQSICGEALLGYDVESRCGVLYLVRQEIWSFTAPVDFEEWALQIAANGYRIGDCDDSRRWLRACCQKHDSPNVVKLFPGKTRH